MTSNIELKFKDIDPLQLRSDLKDRKPVIFPPVPANGYPPGAELISVSLIHLSDLKYKGDAHCYVINNLVCFKDSDLALKGQYFYESFEEFLTDLEHRLKSFSIHSRKTGTTRSQWLLKHGIYELLSGELTRGERPSLHFKPNTEPRRWTNR